MYVCVCVYRKAYAQMSVFLAVDGGKWLDFRLNCICREIARVKGKVLGAGDTPYTCDIRQCQIRC